MSFSRLVRFVSANGKTYIGDAILPAGTYDARLATKAKIITGDILSDYTITDEVQDIKKLLSPLSWDQIRNVRCLGLNYEKHAIESKMAKPKYPVLFFKPITAISGPTDPIPVPAIAQIDNETDYECELVIVIGKKASNVSESDALNYVLGYTVGNDVSQRSWQIKKGGGQWSLGKMFDGWAPIGPALVSTEVIKDPQTLKISTKINGVTQQSENTADMIFGVAKTVSFLSQGSTLLPGDLIFTGTPSGVGMGRKPQYWLKDGDVVEVGLEQVGTIVNKVVYEKGVKAKL
ncbi:fumarylacetoacetate hydrolase domain-containing protein 2-like protein [Kockiozyma suomiensis]|uniref:fumarylacetoacetate hydrolase domain-containing protein 2-like protein n=1 Tax=Kockiozyma suomiensis TaxID=1337062 RepID=UPI003343DF18